MQTSVFRYEKLVDKQAALFLYMLKSHSVIGIEKII